MLTEKPMHCDSVAQIDYAALEARCATLTAEVMHYTAGTPHPLEAENEWLMSLCQRWSENCTAAMARKCSA